MIFNQSYWLPFQNILTMSLEECQTKSFGMNLLLHAMLKINLLQWSKKTMNK